MQHALKLVIFDWDGTLFNSVGQIVASLKFAAQQFEQPLTDEAARSIIGLGLPEVAQQLFPQVPHLHAQILQCYSDHYVENASHDVWFDGVTEMLHDLKQRDVLLAVATGKSRKGLNRVLAQTNSTHLFAATRAASETKSKPNPLMLTEILQQTQIDVKNAMMVGDTSYDLHMAQQLNMRRVGVTFGVHDIATLTQFQPVALVGEIQQLHQFLLQQLS